MPFDPGYDDHGLLGCVVFILALMVALFVLTGFIVYSWFTS